MLQRAFTIFLVFFMWPAVALANPPLLRLGCEQYLPFVDAKKPYGGLLNELLVEAGKIAGYQFEFVSDVPWARLVEEVKIGTYDGLSCSSLTEERKSWLVFTQQPFVHDRLALFALKSRNLAWQEFDDLKKYRIVVRRGTSYQKTLEQIGQNNFQPTKDEMEALQMITGERADIFLSGYLTTLTVIKEAAPEWQDKITALPKFFSEDPLHPSITRKRSDADEVAAKLSQAFAQLVTSGAKTAIFRKHQVVE